MGRRRDPFDVQAAKGHPRKRLSKAERQEIEAQQTAAMLLAAPAESADRFAPPAMFNDPRCLPALTIWRQYAPRLAHINMFSDLNRETLAIFCVYYAEFIEAYKSILDKGRDLTVKTYGGSGATRIFENPAISRMDNATQKILELSKRYGLTPLDAYSLTASQMAALGNGGGGDLFGPRNEQKDEPKAEPAQDEAIGILDRFDSPPPRTLQ